MKQFILDTLSENNDKSSMRLMVYVIVGSVLGMWILFNFRNLITMRDMLPLAIGDLIGVLGVLSIKAAQKFAEKKNGSQGNS